MSRYRNGIMAAIAVAALIKIYLAAGLGLFQDEAFYWMESRRLALSYSDIPPLTALAIRAGTELLGNQVFGVRFVFLLAGALAPLGLYWLAQPIIGRREAWLVAGCGLMLPLMIAVGPVAVADSLMIPITILFIGAFERATRTSAIRWWLLAGLLMALGFLCHYRFAAVAAAAALYVVATRNGRRQLASTGPWLAGVLAIGGLLPVLWSSFYSDHQALQYQFIDRHPWRFDPAGLRFFVSQAVVTTPLLFGFLVAAWLWLGREIRGGDDRNVMLWLFATLPAGIYFLLSPVMGQNFDTFHWPLGGYMSLLVALPAVLRRAPRWLSQTTIVFAAAFTLACAAILALQVHMGFVHRNLPALEFRKNSNFVGWEPMAERAGAWLEKSGGDDLLLIGEHYVTAAQLSFYTGRDVYTTEPWKLARDGRAPQMRKWGLDEAGLLQQAGRDALVVYMASERNRYSPERHQAAMERLCSFFGSVEHVDHLNLWDGNKVFDYYLARDLGAGPAISCPQPRAPD